MNFDKGNVKAQEDFNGKMLKIGFIGGGRMAHAMAKGFISAGLAKAENIIASCHPMDIKCAEEFQAIGASAVFTNKPVVEKSDVVVISVKPSVVPEVLAEVKPLAGAQNKLYISIAMGVTIKELEKNLPISCRVIRAMPNTPALVLSGAAVVAPGTNATKEDADLAMELFRAVGTCDLVSEYSLDAVTALSGSGPAYVYLMIEALADGGVRMGLPRDLSQRLAAQTVAGAAKMVKESTEHPAKLRDDVTSPGGSTAAALYHLEKNAFRGTVIGAIEAATEQCKKVASQMK